MNKKIIVSIFAIVAVATIAAVGSSAYWVDEEDVVKNEMKAGAMDLQVKNTKNGAWLANDRVASLDIQDGQAGQEFSSEVFLRTTENTTVDGEITVYLKEVTNSENGVIEPELEDGDTLDLDQGELCTDIKVRWTFGNTSDSSDDVSTEWIRGISEGKTYTFNTPAILKAAGDDMKLTAEYKIVTWAGNDIMTDTCNFNAVAKLTQIQE